jgi:phosphotransferase system enzyme I (PtsI)
MDAYKEIPVTTEFTGIPVSPGIAMARTFRFKHIDLGMLKDHGFPVENVSDEITRLERAITESAEQVGRLQAEAPEHTGGQVAEIFKAHAELLQDEPLLSRIRSLVSEKGVNAEYVLANEIAEIESRFSSINEEHLQVRLLDIQDVLHRLLRNLLDIEHVRTNPLRRINHRVVLIAETLLPSDMTLLDLKHIAGIVLEQGSAASHVAIMARAMRIPAVFRVASIGSVVRNNDFLIVDGSEGRVILNPSKETIDLYEKSRERKKKIPVKTVPKNRCRTKDGKPVSLLANAASAQEVENAFIAGAEGIGLFRTEFYYMSRHRLPTLEEETGFYRQVLSICRKRPLTLRLLDLGADKTLPYLRMTPEQNPQLGMRGIRYLLGNSDIFHNHLVSLVRASAVAPLQLLVPFVSRVEEIAAVRDRIDSIAREEGVGRERISLGMMVEIPAVIFSLPSFMGLVDFISIGTNDLIQYTFAADRDHGQLEEYRRTALMVISRMIKYIVVNARSANKEVTVCGEMAGDPRYAEILVGLGVHSLSMQPDSIAAVCSALGRKSYKELIEDAERFILSPLDKGLFSFPDEAKRHDRALHRP